MLAHDVRSASVLEGAPLGPTASSQGQVRAVGHPNLIGPGGLGLVKQAVGGAAQPVSRIGRTRGKGLRLQRVQATAANWPGINAAGPRRARSGATPLTAGGYRSGAVAPQRPSPKPFPRLIFPFS